MCNELTCAQIISVQGDLKRFVFSASEISYYDHELIKGHKEIMFLHPPLSNPLSDYFF